MRDRRSIAGQCAWTREGVRQRVRVRATAFLPTVLLGGLTMAAPLGGLGGTTTSAVASTHEVLKPAQTQSIALVDPAATSVLVQLYLGIAALAAVIIVFAIVWLRTAESRQARRAESRAVRASVVWTDALTTTARTDRSPAPAPRASRPRSLPTASAQRV